MSLIGDRNVSGCLHIFGVQSVWLPAHLWGTKCLVAYTSLGYKVSGCLHIFGVQSGWLPTHLWGTECLVACTTLGYKVSGCLHIFVVQSAQELLRAPSRLYKNSIVNKRYGIGGGCHDRKCQDYVYTK